MRVEKDFKEFIKLLNEHKVKYLVVGGFAVSYYARARYTKDIDIWIEVSKENAKKILKVLELFGFSDVGLRLEDFLEKDNIIQLGYEPVRIDILMSISEVEFEDAWKNKFIGKYGDEYCYYISIDDLIKNKSSTGRPIDKEDVKFLEKAKEKKSI